MGSVLPHLGLDRSLHVCDYACCVLRSQTDMSLDGSNIRRALIATLDMVKIQNLYSHDRRYTFSARMAKTGKDR